MSILQRIHDAGVIHNDLESRNILKFDQGNGCILFSIIDFGLATLLDANQPRREHKEAQNHERACFEVMLNSILVT